MHFIYGILIIIFEHFFSHKDKYSQLYSWTFLSLIFDIRYHRPFSIATSPYFVLIWNTRKHAICWLLVLQAVNRQISLEQQLQTLKENEQALQSLQESLSQLDHTLTSYLTDRIDSFQLPQEAQVRHLTDIISPVWKLHVEAFGMEENYIICTKSTGPLMLNKQFLDLYIFILEVY